MPPFFPSHRLLQAKGWQALPYQEEVWGHIGRGASGLVYSSTGTGKTLSVWLGFLDHLAQGPGLKAIWVTPLRSLAADTLFSLREASELGEVPLRIEPRTGDTGSYAKQQQLKNTPDVLVTTPESLTLLLTLKAAQEIFAGCRLAVVDEWHELLGSKRGVQTELALARLRRLAPGLQTWGLSATLGNIAEAAEILAPGAQPVVVRGETDKETVIDCLLPGSLDRFPWAGHLGLSMAQEVAREIGEAKSSLVFCNTRAQAEIWHQALLSAGDGWSDQVALHHGSLDASVREVAEQGLKQGALKCVVCTSSLDLGVDFSPVDRVFQIGSPKGVARLLQRAGRSGHRPGAPSRVTCVPTHAWELLDIASAREGARRGRVEGRRGLDKPMDVLAQHLVSMALGQGFDEEELFREVKTAFTYRGLEREEFNWALEFVTRGGESLRAYPEFRKVVWRQGRYRVEDKDIALRHRVSIGTIVSDQALDVKMMTGQRLGSVEESFASRLRRGDCFIFAGRALEFVMMKDLAVLVKKAGKPKGFVPRWGGGRMPLSSELALTAREKLEDLRDGVVEDEELQFALPLLAVQSEWSALPRGDELLIERVKTTEGHHLFIYPIEGRLVHEGLAALCATRFNRIRPLSFSLACNDYGFELLSPEPAPLEEALAAGLFSVEGLKDDILASLNGTEMAKRQFREIARVAGLVHQGYPGAPKTAKQVQASSGLLFDVFSKYDPGHLLLRQADEEVLQKSLEQSRLHTCLLRLSSSRPLITEPPRPTPMAFPILVDRLRETVGEESIEDRIRRLAGELEEAAG